MKLTTNYGLKKPGASDIVNIDDFNYNADAIDSAIKTVEDVVSANKTSILELQAEVNGQRLRGINIANAIIDKLEG